MKMRYLFLIYLFTFSPGLLSACATCYGAPDAPATQGLNMAILVLLGFISAILLIISLSIFSIYKKSKLYHSQVNYEPTIK
tara:strand:- start:195 stop:437 length:243 start_codon:yes stop_codon:yes gene_type:complete